MDEQAPIDVRELRVGTRLKADIFDSAGVLLLRAGSPITARFLDLLAARNIQQVHRQPLDMPASRARGGGGRDDSHGEAPRQADPTSERLEESIGDWLRSEPPNGWSWPQTPSGGSRGSALRGTMGSLFADAQSDVAQLTACCRTTSAQRLEEARLALEQHLNRLSALLRADRDAVLLAAHTSATMPDIYVQGVRASLIAMGMALHLGFDDAALLDVGFSTLFADLGMMRIPKAIREAPSLNAGDRAVLQQHPIYTADLFHDAGVSLARQIIAYQTHERNDGSGYPRKRHAMFIHPLARIAAVAHTYVTKCSDRPHRPAMLPYDATTFILHESAAQRLDRVAVRAFLNVMSLFPIGSYVQLSNARFARVCRATGPTHTRPVVTIVDDDAAMTDEMIDLGQVRTVDIIRPVPVDKIIGDDAA
jgi:HD-GYP domain-containing protein (c-di-GMP phosphodiesterase class II)